jgi:hypothetical protein
VGFVPFNDEVVVVPARRVNFKRHRAPQSCQVALSAARKRWFHSKQEDNTKHSDVQAGSVLILIGCCAGVATSQTKFSMARSND